jgi:hypothetical protein
VSGIAEEVLVLMIASSIWLFSKEFKTGSIDLPKTNRENHQRKAISCLRSKKCTKFMSINFSFTVTWFPLSTNTSSNTAAFTIFQLNNKMDKNSFKQKKN